MLGDERAHFGARICERIDDLCRREIAANGEQKSRVARRPALVGDVRLKRVNVRWRVGVGEMQRAVRFDFCFLDDELRAARERQPLDEQRGVAVSRQLVATDDAKFARTTFALLATHRRDERQRRRRRERFAFARFTCLRFGGSLEQRKRRVRRTNAARIVELNAVDRNAAEALERRPNCFYADRSRVVVRIEFFLVFEREWHAEFRDETMLSVGAVELLANLHLAHDDDDDEHNRNARRSPRFASQNRCCRHVGRGASRCDRWHV